MNLNEIPDTDGMDAATRWAVWEEFNLRSERYEIHRTGIAGAMRRLAAAFRGAEPLIEAPAPPQIVYWGTQPLESMEQR